MNPFAILLTLASSISAGVLLSYAGKKETDAPADPQPGTPTPSPAPKAANKTEQPFNAPASSAHKAKPPRKQAGPTKRQAKRGNKSSASIASLPAPQLAGLYRKTKVTQVTIDNPDTSAQTITIWGNNDAPQSTSSNPTGNHQLQATAATGVHPVGLAVHPNYNLAFVANQLSNSVAVVNAVGAVLFNI